MRYRFLIKEFVLFTVFGFIYSIIEIFFRGYTFNSMFIVGGLCGVLIGLINDKTPQMPLIYQCLIGSLIVTTIEFISGYILNIHLGLGIWDYSNQPYNFMGQICPMFSVAWFFLSIPVIYLDDYLKETILK